MILLHFHLVNTYCLCLIPCEISFLNHNRRDSKMEKIKTLQIFFSLLDNVIFWSAFERMTIFHATDFLTPNKFLWKYCEIHFIYLYFSKVIFHVIEICHFDKKIWVLKILFMNKSCIFRFSNVKEKVKVAFTFNKSLKPQIKGMPQTTNCDNSKRSAYIIAIDNGSNEWNCVFFF